MGTGRGRLANYYQPIRMASATSSSVQRAVIRIHPVATHGEGCHQILIESAWSSGVQRVTGASMFSCRDRFCLSAHRTFVSHTSSAHRQRCKIGGCSIWFRLRHPFYAIKYPCRYQSWSSMARRWGNPLTSANSWKGSSLSQWYSKQTAKLVCPD